MMNELDILKVAIEASIEGGQEILDVYSREFDVEFKDDKSPLTLADKRAHIAISRKLESTGLPILSEEGKHIHYETRSHWERFWLVDPLDGTKEFVKRNGEFTVNIALVVNQTPQIGVIYVPVNGQLYFASESTGARKIMVIDPVHAQAEDMIKNAMELPINAPGSRLVVVCSRSHMSPETGEYVEELEAKGHKVDFISIGSSLKMCLIAEGKAQVYPRFGPTMEWDTAAGHAIVEKSGGKVVLSDGSGSLKYNKPQLLNPWFIASRPY